jgi:hypothetical protein
MQEISAGGPWHTMEYTEVVQEQHQHRRLRIHPEPCHPRNQKAWYVPSVVADLDEHRCLCCTHIVVHCFCNINLSYRY